MSANVFASAVERFNAGRLDEAERLCRDVLMFDKGHFDALNMLGIIATRVGNLDAAVELYGRALAVNGRSAECHFNLGQVLRAQGRNSEAMAHLGEATAIKRDYVAQLHADMLLHLHDMLRLSRGHLGDAWSAVVNSRSGRQSAQARLCRGLQQSRRRTGGAESFTWKRPSNIGAHSLIKPGLVDTYRNLARALLEDGQADEADGNDHTRPRDRRNRRSQGDIRSVRTIGDEYPSAERLFAISLPAP